MNLYGISARASDFSVSPPSSPYIVTGQSFGARLTQAIFALQSQIGRRVGYAEIGALTAKKEGRKKAYSVTAVSEWVNGRSEPGLDALRALALTLGVPVAWLAFGEDVNQKGGTTMPPRDGPGKHTEPVVTEPPQADDLTLNEPKRRRRRKGA